MDSQQTQMQQDVALMLAAQCHLGTKNATEPMQRYVFRRSPTTGINIINLSKTYEKLKMAARVIVAIENPKDVIALSGRPYGQRAVLKFAKHVDCMSEAGRHTPGTFTNQIIKTFQEPRLIVATDPRTDHQAIKEASYMGIPCIAFADTDSPLQHVDIAIPCNNRGRHSIAVMWYLLARMVLEMRGLVSADKPFEGHVDLFFFREPEEAEEEGYGGGGLDTAADFGGGGGYAGGGARGAGAFGGFAAALPGERAAAMGPADEGWGGPAPGEGYGAAPDFEAADFAAPPAEFAAPPPPTPMAAAPPADAFGGGFAPETFEPALPPYAAPPPVAPSPHPAASAAAYADTGPSTGDAAWE